jgi:hypothetical protein
VTGRPRRLAAVLTVTLTAALVATGCASIPGSSRPQIIAESVPASPPAEDDDLRYDELVPRPGESPVDIVRNFLRAGGSYERSHARARAYLSPAGDKALKENAGAVLLEDSPYLNVSSDGTVVTMTGRQRGRLDPDGAYVPGESPYPYDFRLRKVDGNWRIENPPSTLLLEAQTFEVAYRAYEVYFLDATRTRVVPDVRWFAAARDILPSLLMTALERGPSQWLKEGVLSDLEGIEVPNNVELAPDRVRVFLTGLNDQDGTLTSGGFAQIVWTLNQVGVGGVEIYADGRLLTPKDAPGRALQQLNDWRDFSADGPFVPTGYFLRGGAVWQTNNTPVAGPAGRSSFRALSVAGSTDQKALAVVTRRADGRQELRTGAPGSLRLAVAAGSLTRPTFGGGSGEVWTVRDGRDVLLVPSNGAPVRVDVPSIGTLGAIRALRLSRDGSRVALVAGAPGAERLWVGVVIREGGSVSINRLRELETGDVPVSDVSWADSLSMIALAGRPKDSSLFTVDVSGVSGGRRIDTTGLPAPPTAVAAGPASPLLTVAAGTLWSTPASDQTWSPATANGLASAPTYPG